MNRLITLIDFTKVKKDNISLWDQFSVPIFSLTLFFGIIVLSFISRLYNLNYNTPFNDEAIYIVLGKLGLFNWDWWSYNAKAWMAGYPYVYPVMTAAAYVLGGGIWGSRFLNVLFNILTIPLIFSITRTLVGRESDKGYIAGIIASVVIATASISLFVSRLATYDMPSFYFLALSFYFLFKVQMSPPEFVGKWYFLSSAALLFGFLCKIIVAVYIPFIIAISILQLIALGKSYVPHWLRYFITPIVLLLSFFTLVNFTNLLSYTTTQTSREKVSYVDLLLVVWTNSKYTLYLAAAGIFGMLFKKRFLQTGVLLLGATGIILFHLITNRFYTFDKHLYITLLFLSPLIGIGLAELIYLVKSKILRSIVVIQLFITMLLFIGVNYEDSLRFNTMWVNADSSLRVLQRVVKPDDKVLAETGATAVLAASQNTYATNIKTFDWLEYRDLKGADAYAAAVREGYFDVIELDAEWKPKQALYQNIHNVVRDNITPIYKLISNDNGDLVYVRAY